MKANIKPKAFVTIAAMLFMTACFAQVAYDGDALASYLGKSTESPEIKGLVSNYKCEMGNPAHCISVNGIELMMQKGMLAEIRLYKTSNVYGSFKGKLPKGIKFGMSPADVRALLGKPSVNYNSGYSEFDLRNYVIACWFEGGRLSQLSISPGTTSL
jgi:hypothetical protein